MEYEIVVSDRIGSFVAGMLAGMTVTGMPARTRIVLDTPDPARLCRLLHRLDDAGVEIELLRLRVSGRGRS